ncbi:putative exporter [Oceanisphaera litoralis]|uniref:MMPL family transporter n=1 Tax=Oceanisphaera litoralis TaxID=225144 RepID=UPI00195A95D9|nr:hypothetical protein [Oceanisphaera litoralis]MBM7456141.1 putative exporter [Oceanisphaera litoralis]
MNPGKAGMRFAALLWLAVILAACILAWHRGPVVDTSLMALLPASEQQPLVKRAIERQTAEFSDKLLMVVATDDNDNAQAAVRLAATRLQALEGVARLTWQAPLSDPARDELFPYRFTLLSSEARERLNSENGVLQYQMALQRLFDPLSGFSSDLLRDPFGLYSDLALSLQSGVPIRVENGLLRLVAAERPSYLLSLQLTADPFSLKVQQVVRAVLDPLGVELQQQGVSLYRSGLLLHAAAGAEQARAEISTIGLGSLVGIILLMLVVFRSIWPLGLALLPVVIGSLMATAVTLLLFGRIHMITVAFGAGLVGVAVDYAMHFICEARVLPREQIIRKLFSGLLLGLVSSVVAYAGLALAPFPGLRQMAVFCGAGLMAAWLTVLVWLPVLGRQARTGPLPAALWLERLRNAYPRICMSPWLAGLTLGLVLISGAIIWHGTARDDVTLLQTSPDRLLAEDRQVQTLLGNGSSAVFLLVTGADFEQVLRAEERLQAQLVRLQDENLLQGYSALSQVLPSHQRQAENGQRVKVLYRSQWLALADLLQLSGEQRTQAMAHMGRGVETFLLPEQWHQLEFSHFWSRHIISERTGDMATLIHLKGEISKSLKDALTELAELEPNVYFVDHIGSLNELMASYRDEITNWLLLAYSGVILMLALRYRQRVWRIVLPPLLASLMAFAGFLLLNDGYNLFNLIALMLVLGIGLDMGIFLHETGDSDHTWLAVSLSAFSSLLAFGLLALSQTPVLYHFGAIVLPGLLLTWLLAPLMRASSKGEITNGRAAGTL